MIRHVVMWKLKDEALGLGKEALKAELKKRLEALVGRVPGVVTFEVGINQVPGDTVTDVCLVSTFVDRAGLQAYGDHPAHQEVVAFIKQVAAERRAADYPVEA
jgi:hypothetical protein